MKLKLKNNAVNVPIDDYGTPCPNAFVKDISCSFDYRNKQLNVDWAIYRSEEEANSNKKPIRQGVYVWTKEARPSVYAPDIAATYEPDIPATYSKEILEERDENNNVVVEYKASEELTPFIKGAEITPFIKGELLIPRFGAFDDVTNITVTVGGTEFGEKGDIWISMHSEWKDYEIVK